MIVDEDLLARARKENRDAMIEVGSMQYPGVHRMAYALCGRADVGEGIVRFIMRRSFRVMPSWKDAEAPQRWFRHHTILTARRAARHQPATGTDTLLDARSSPDPAYAAFVQAFRGLPYQQREAFLLHHAEQLDTRATAVAMDCSTTAASQHLQTATARLRELAGPLYQSFVARLAETYLKLAPSSDLILSDVSRSVRKYLWPRRLARFVFSAALLLILFALTWAGVKWWRAILVWFNEVFSR